MGCGREDEKWEPLTSLAQPGDGPRGRSGPAQRPCEAEGATSRLDSWQHAGCWQGSGPPPAVLPGLQRGPEWPGHMASRMEGGRRARPAKGHLPHKSSSSRCAPGLVAAGPRAGEAVRLHGLLREGARPPPRCAPVQSRPGGSSTLPGWRSGPGPLLREAKAPPGLRPCSKCWPGSGEASPALCTLGAHSPR